MSLSKLKWINWNLYFPFLYTFAFWYSSSLIITLSFKTYLTFWGGNSGFYFPSVTTVMLCWNGLAQKVHDNRGLLQHLHTTHTHTTHTTYTHHTYSHRINHCEFLTIFLSLGADHQPYSWNLLSYSLPRVFFCLFKFFWPWNSTEIKHLSYLLRRATRQCSLAQQQDPAAFSWVTQQSSP